MSNRLCCGVESKYVDNIPGKEYYYCTLCKNEVTSTSPLFSAATLAQVFEELYIKEYRPDLRYEKNPILDPVPKDAYSDGSDISKDKTSVDPNNVQEDKIFYGHYHPHRTAPPVTYIGSPYTISSGEALIAARDSLHFKHKELVRDAFRKGDIDARKAVDLLIDASRVFLAGVLKNESQEPSEYGTPVKSRSDYVFRAFLNGEIDSDQAVLLLNHEDSGAKLERMDITPTTDNSFIVTRELWESWNSQDED